MRKSFWAGLLCLFLGGWAGTLAEVRAQAPAVKGPAPAKAAETPRPAGLDLVVATVNGDKITKGDLLNFLSRYPIPPWPPSRSIAMPWRR